MRGAAKDSECTVLSNQDGRATPTHRREPRAIGELSRPEKTMSKSRCDPHDLQGRHAARPIVMITAVLLCTAAGPADASEESARLRARAYQLAYNLDYDEATRQMEAAVAADSGDAAAERGLAVIPWLLISFSRDAATVDDYLGSISRQNVAMRQPPPELAARFSRHITRAMTIAEADLKRRPRDPEALYQIG